ncbi:MAG: hypothetical protein AB1765_13300, partial [Candidatus Hydrogenedentota bacterium]
MKKKLLLTFLVVSFLLVSGSLFADIEISGHIVTVWSDAQHDEVINDPGATTAVQLNMASGPIYDAANPLSDPTAGRGTA